MRRICQRKPQGVEREGEREREWEEARERSHHMLCCGNYSTRNKHHEAFVTHRMLEVGQGVGAGDPGIRGAGGATSWFGCFSFYLYLFRFLFSLLSKPG